MVEMLFEPRIVTRRKEKAMLVANRELRIGLAWAGVVCAALAGSARAQVPEPKSGAPDNSRRPDLDGKGQDGPGVKEADKKARAKSRPRPGVDWLELEAGLFQVRSRRLPGLILFDLPGEAPGAAKPSEDDTPPPHFLEELLTDTGMKETLRRFVLIRIRPEDLGKPYPPLPPDAAGKKNVGKKARADGKAVADDPPPVTEPAVEAAVTIGARLGLGGQQAALVAINYWESAELTYKDGNPPTRTRLKEDLARFWKVNGVYAEIARRVEPDYEKSKYAAVQKNQREATLKIRDYEAPRWQNQMDPILKKRVNELLGDYRARAQKAIEAANALDQARKWQEAIAAFDKVSTDFPFTDIQKQANIRKGECLRKMTFGL